MNQALCNLVWTDYLAGAIAERSLFVELWQAQQIAVVLPAETCHKPITRSCCSEGKTFLMSRERNGWDDRDASPDYVFIRPPKRYIRVNIATGDCL